MKSFKAADGEICNLIGTQVILVGILGGKGAEYLELK